MSVTGKGHGKAPRVAYRPRSKREASYDVFLLLVHAHGLPAPETEFVFAPPRKWRADYCWPAAMVIVEREGGIWRGGNKPGSAMGGHSAGAGILRDMEKGNAAQLLGYVYLRYTPRQLASGEVVEILKALLRHERATLSL